MIDNIWKPNAPIGTVVAYYRGWNNLPILSTIEALTKTQFKLKSGDRVRREDGRVIGQSYTFAFMPTIAQISQFKVEGRKLQLVRELRDWPWPDEDIEVLEKVREALEKNA